MPSAWPINDLQIRTSETVLKLMPDDDMLSLAEISQGAVLGPGQENFLADWVRQDADVYAQNFAQYHWSCRANWKPENWNLLLGVYVNGQELPVGVQGINASNFNKMRVVSTGSWLLHSAQGKGVGKLMRASVLQLAFMGLHAEHAISMAAMNNERSNRVSKSMGYKENGTAFLLLGGQKTLEQRYLISSEDWIARSDIEIVGLEPCLKLFGAE